MRKLVSGLGAAALLGVASTSPISAAPDNALGMALLFAVVNSNGLLASGSGTTSSNNLGTPGTYEVIFNRDVTNCAYTATVGEVGSQNAAAARAVTRMKPHSSNPNGVYLETRDLAANLAAAPFYLMVFCTR